MSSLFAMVTDLGTWFFFCVAAASLSSGLGDPVPSWQCSMTASLRSPPGLASFVFAPAEQRQTPQVAK